MSKLFLDVAVLAQGKEEAGDITHCVLECHSLHFLMGSPLWAEKE